MEIQGYELPDAIIQALQIRYPQADVNRELLLANLWLAKNPASRPKRPLRFVENWLKKVSPKAPLVDLKRAQWWTSEKATLEMGRSVGLAPRGNESWGEFRARISDRLSQRRSA